MYIKLIPKLFINSWVKKSDFFLNDPVKVYLPEGDITESYQMINDSSISLCMSWVNISTNCFSLSKCSWGILFSILMRYPSNLQCLHISTNFLIIKSILSSLSNNSFHIFSPSVHSVMTVPIGNYKIQSVE